MNNIKRFCINNKLLALLLLLISLVAPISTTLLPTTASADCTNPAVCGGPTGGNNAYQFTVNVEYDPSKNQPATDTISIPNLATSVVKPQTVSIKNYVATATFKFNYYDKLDSANACSVVMKQESSKNACASSAINGGKATLTISYKGSSDISGNPSDNSGQDNPSTCQVDGIGWIICPVMNFMAKVTNAVYGVVSDMLTTPALNTNTSDSGNALYQTWSSFRNIANIAFVIAFLVIIYSQVTSFGITNYGIKKMLPRIIIAAILVNISYWVCAVAVDISNIIGSSVVGAFSSATPKFTPADGNFNGGNGDINWVGGTAAILILGGAALYAGLTVLLPMLVTAVVAILTVVVVLTARQAIIILLVAISPLAFVAFLLPNTEKWFKKWREIFVAMLVMFPVIAAVFGASKLASAIIMQTAGHSPEASKLTLQLMGAGVSIIPLIISPIVMKASTGVLSKIGGYVNNPNRGPFDRMRKGAATLRERRQNIRKGAALSGSRRVFGGGQFRRAERGNLRNQLAEAQAKSGASVFARHDGTAVALDQQARTANSWASTNETMRGVDWQRSAAGQAATQAQMNAETEGKAVKVDAEIQNIRTAPGVRLNLEAANAQLGAAKAGEKALIEELKTSKGTPPSPALAEAAADLRAATEDEHILNLRAGSAARVLQQEQAKELANNPTLRAEGAGIDPFGDRRILASATQAQFKAFDEAVGNQKSLYSEENVNAHNFGKAGPITPGSLDAIVRDSSKSAEERAAAVSRIMETGSDRNIHELLDYLGNADPKIDSSIPTIQKQAGADLGVRKPKSIGQADLSNLKTGKYSGNFNTKVEARVDGGKQSGETLAGAGVDELERILAVMSTTPPKGADAVASRAALKTSISDYYATVNKTGRQIPKETKELMDRIEGVL